MDLASAWEHHAREWIAWARAPGHDSFWRGPWPALRAALPPPAGLVIELGCGEGRVCRELSRLGYRIVGLDRSPTMTQAAKAASPALPFTLADAAALPFADGSAALVISCMSLHDMDDLAGVLRECARVLRPRGQLHITTLHPFATVEDDDTVRSPAFRVSRPYLQTRHYQDHVERDGLRMTFTGVHRPLGAYTAALLANHFVLTDLTEMGERNIPWLLVLRAERR
ncbi:MAG TPA: class I SAM-dependent methyltransferase [Streptosporangiaceae bacterium]|nr:class I SAM-dependent methyltransferase [Streptosporangiaceae bacterium]